MDYVVAVLTIFGIPAMFIAPLVGLAYVLRCQEPNCDTPNHKFWLFR